VRMERVADLVAQLGKLALAAGLSMEGEQNAALREVVASVTDDLDVGALSIKVIETVRALDVYLQTLQEPRAFSQDVAIDLEIASLESSLTEKRRALAQTLAMLADEQRSLAALMQAQP